MSDETKELVSDEERFEIEVFDGEEKQEGVSEELLVRLRKGEEELAGLREQLAGGKDKAILDGFRSLGETLERRTEKQDEPHAQGQLEDYTVFRERLKDKAFTDPVAAMEEFVKRYEAERIAPAFGHLSQQVAGTAQVAGRISASSDPTNKLVMEKWGDEVEKLAKGLQGADAFERACKQVAMNHIGEIVQMKVEEAVAGSSEGGEKKEVPGAKGEVPGGGAAGPAEKGGGKVVRLTKKEMEDAKTGAAARGMELNDYVRYVMGRT